MELPKTVFAALEPMDPLAMMELYALKMTHVILGLVQAILWYATPTHAKSLALVILPMERANMWTNLMELPAMMEMHARQLTHVNLELVLEPAV